MEKMVELIDALYEEKDAHPVSKKIQKENEILHSILDSLSEGVIVADTSGKFLYFNQSAQAILGIGSKEVGVEQWSSLYGCYFPDTVTPYPSSELPLAKAIRGEEVTEEIIFIRNRKRPEGIYISISASPLKNESKHIRGGTVIFRDVSAKERAELSRKQSEARLSAQFKGIPIPTYVWQKKGNDFILIDYNTAAEKITKNRIHQYKGGELSQIYAHIPEIQDYFHECIHNDNQPISREMSYRMVSTGEQKDLIVHFVKIPPDMILVHTVDVTEIKSIEKELRKLSNAVEKTADSVVITDKNGVIEYVNPAFESTTGYIKTEVLGRNISLLKSGEHDQNFYTRLWNTISNGKHYTGLIINRKKEGNLYWSEQTITPMQDDNGRINHYVSVLRDITQIRKQQEQDFQMNLAREVQSQLYHSQRSVSALEFSGSSIPAAETNGDYYDILTLSDGCMGVIIGDVSGHGISSALIMAQTRAYLHAFSKHTTDPGILLTWLNQELVNDLEETRFVTLVFLRLDLKHRRMVYASAGHIPGLLLTSSGRIKRKLESTGIPLAFIPDYQYINSEPVPFNPGDFFILLTDGIVEAHDQSDEEFGLTRALRVIKEARSLTIQDIQKRLHEAVLDFSSGVPQEDDITSVICKFNPD
jgi:PAS domain S-box-containing protein